jgi:hypothetical protein
MEPTSSARWHAMVPRPVAGTHCVAAATGRIRGGGQCGAGTVSLTARGVRFSLSDFPDLGQAAKSY